jgi:hypothetical protein
LTSHFNSPGNGRNFAIFTADVSGAIDQNVGFGNPAGLGMLSAR